MVACRVFRRVDEGGTGAELSGDALVRSIDGEAFRVM
jgi:hypothetical protein